MPLNGTPNARAQEVPSPRMNLLSNVAVASESVGDMLLPHFRNDTELKLEVALKIIKELRPNSQHPLEETFLQNPYFQTRVLEKILKPKRSWNPNDDSPRTKRFKVAQATTQTEEWDRIPRPGQKIRWSRYSREACIEIFANLLVQIMISGNTPSEIYKVWQDSQLGVSRATIAIAATSVKKVYGLNKRLGILKRYLKDTNMCAALCRNTATHSFSGKIGNMSQAQILDNGEEFIEFTPEIHEAVRVALLKATKTSETSKHVFNHFYSN